ncbi:MAG: hypothetical protein H0W86_08655 [Armatimonadetes bacterium]|nr:hypothetical protein [Armatimonadota bacterium]
MSNRPPCPGAEWIKTSSGSRLMKLPFAIMALLPLLAFGQGQGGAAP